MSPAVLDASALLAWLRDEPGAELVTEALSESVVSTVNWSEVGQKINQRGGDAAGTLNRMAAVGVQVAAFTTRNALAAAELWHTTSPIGLSLADRACLALAQERELPVLTADTAWSKLDIGVEVQLIR